MKFLATDIDRREWATLGRDRFAREYLSSPRPVIVTGGMDHWPARTQWTPEFFSQQHGARSVTVDGQRWPLGELIDTIRVSTPDWPAPYLRNQLLADLCPELLADVSPMPECTQPNWLESRAIPAWHPLTYLELTSAGQAPCRRVGGTRHASWVLP